MEYDSALIAIHGFEPGRSSGMWQRHGIATASAKLAGGAVFGAAHFGRLPSSAAVQTLAASRVPRRHLGLGDKRKAEALPPVGYVSDDRFLLRFFKG
jgi:hypothetical protein